MLLKAVPGPSIAVVLPSFGFAILRGSDAVEKVKPTTYEGRENGQVYKNSFDDRDHLHTPFANSCGFMMTTAH